MKNYPIAFVGCGNVSRMHFSGYLAHPERVTITGGCDPSTERQEHVTQQYGISKTFSTLEELVAQADWEVAIVCTPTPIRAPLIAQLSSAGKHIFVEKPMADTLDEAKNMVDLCEQAGVSLAVDQNFRYFYPFSIARDLIQEGALGNILSITHRNLTFRQDSGWRTQCARHALSVMGVHWLDGFRWILGKEAATMFCQTTSSPAIDCVGDTDATVLITFPGGTTVSYEQSFSSQVRQTDTVIIGEEGTLFLDHEHVILYTKISGQTPARQWDIPKENTRKPEATYQALDQFLTALEQGHEPENSGRDNLNTIALLDAAYQSAETHRIVTL
ncbi:MAG: Gfo/Idh/MocA family oxidoreductase [bacterium]|nr:Gfo/Idh/MocA family oxidoreductase [bacterium]